MKKILIFGVFLFLFTPLKSEATVALDYGESAFRQNQTGCPQGLSLYLTTGGLVCRKVYLQNDVLPVGCNRSEANGSAYGPLLCHPYDSFSYLLRGQKDGIGLPPGTRLVNESLAPNIGWLFDQPETGQFIWNGGGSWFGGVDDMGRSWQGPIPAPTNLPLPASFGHCNAAKSVFDGMSAYVYSNGSVQTLVTIDEREACMVYSAARSCGMDVNENSIPNIFPRSFSESKCSSYGISIPSRESSQTGNGGVGTGVTTPPSNGGQTGSPGTNPTTPTTPITSVTSVITFLDRLSNNILGINPNLSNTARPQMQSGTITVSVPILNIRSRANTSGSLVNRLILGQRVIVVGWVVGQNVEGVDRWWKDQNGNYIWSGGTVEQPSGTPLSENGTQSSNTTNNFAIGQRVRTTDNLNVRLMPSITSTLVGVERANSEGVILSDKTFADGYYWWRVEYNSGITGWSVDDYLIVLPVRR